MYYQLMREIMGPEGRLRMLHLGITEYSSGGELITNYSSPDFVGRRHKYPIPGGQMVEVTITKKGFKVYDGQKVIEVQPDPHKDQEHQPRLVLLGDGYLLPTLSK